MRVIGLDLGTKTIGVATSDETGTIALPLVTIERTSIKADLDEVMRLVSDNGATSVVVGLPVSMDGSLGAGHKYILDFAERLRSRSGVEVQTWDERMSTVAVTRVLIDADVSRKGRKKVVDKLAACYILQGYLDARASRRLSQEDSDGKGQSD